MGMLSTAIVTSLVCSTPGLPPYSGETLAVTADILTRPMSSTKDITPTTPVSFAGPVASARGFHVLVGRPPTKFTPQGTSLLAKMIPLPSGTSSIHVSVATRLAAVGGQVSGRPGLTGQYTGFLPLAGERPAGCHSTPAFCGPCCPQGHGFRCAAAAESLCRREVLRAWPKTGSKRVGGRSRTRSSPGGSPVEHTDRRSRRRRRRTGASLSPQRSRSPPPRWLRAQSRSLNGTYFSSSAGRSRG